MADDRGATILSGIGPSPRVRSTGYNTKRCNPYGHESGGPQHLLGGMYGPQFEGQTKWICENPAEVRARMMCRKGHKGQVMDLCRQHAVEIQKRQSGLCPPCAWPPEALMHHEIIEKLQNEIAFLSQIGRFDSPEARSKRADVEVASTRMTELYQSGVIQKNPLKLTEIS